MGSSHSKVLLEELSVEDIRAHVTGLGTKYAGYGDAIVENAVDGELLLSLEDDAEVKETMECLDITNFLHQRVLLKEWRKAKKTMVKSNSSNGSGSGSKDQEEDIHKGREIETRTVATGTSSMGDLTSTSFSESASSSSDKLYPSDDVVQTLEELELQEDDHGLTTESEEIQPYCNVAVRALEDLKGSYAAVNLVSAQTLGHNSLCTSFYTPEGAIQNTRLHIDGDKDMSVCRSVILGSNEEFVQIDIPEDVSKEYGMKEAARYYGHIVKCGNLRVGMVCAVLEESRIKSTTEDEKQVILKFLAAETERQLQRRKVLVQRNQNLKRDIEQLKQQQQEQEQQQLQQEQQEEQNRSVPDHVILPAYGPLNPVMASHVDCRLDLFPYPHPDADDGGVEVRRSVELPSWCDPHLATEAERAHLPPTYYDPLQGFPIDVTPVAKDDMERVALLNTLGILDMEPSSEEAKTILALINMTGLLLGMDYIFINLLDQVHRHMMLPTLCSKDKQKDLGRMASLLNSMQPIKSTADGNPFLVRGDRSTAICNYAVASPRGQAFVIHDVSKDQSFALYKRSYDIGFCSAAPIIIRGMAVGALCCVCKEARPDFGKPQEVQLEQFSQLIAQQFETWSLNREMRQLERERSMLLDNSQKLRANRPEDHAALVFTDVQGSTDLWEANSDAMNKALVLHNQIIRQHITAHSGYEVSNEGDAFHVAFVDVVDSVQFCLKVQEALDSAPWDHDILGLPNAQEDAVGCFRGLRVRMAIHAGDVVPSTSDLSGRVAYGGETYHIAKSLESMSHGGQILVTSDVWNVASHLAESILGSPQVVDLGHHVMLTHSSNMYDGIIAKNVLQLVPSSLSHDYLVSRRVAGPNAENVDVAHRGRTFPPVNTKKCLSASFHDAPFANNTVTMVFVYTSEAEKLVQDPSVLLAALSKRIGAILNERNHDQNGYQCKDFMLAFGNVDDALRFGLAIQQYLETHTILDLSLAGLVKVGVCEGEFTAMGPHPTTGRADYFGKVVNRAARVAAAATPGCVFLGKEATALDECNLMPLSNGYMLDFLGVWPLKGVKEEFALYKCHACNSWYDQFLSNNPGEPKGPRAFMLPRFQG